MLKLGEKARREECSVSHPLSSSPPGSPLKKEVTRAKVIFIFVRSKSVMCLVHGMSFRHRAKTIIYSLIT